MQAFPPVFAPTFSSKLQNQSAITKPNRNSQPNLPSIKCKILVNPSKKTLPKPLIKPPPPPLPRNPELFPQEQIPSLNLNPFQKLAASALDLIETKLIAQLEKNHKLNRTTDPEIQLEGNFAPVQECPVRHDIEVVGEIPSSLYGVYVRNGGNPLYKPINGHHLFDGDGMIHAVTLRPGNKASYACRFTRTNRLVQELAMGRSVFPKSIGELHGHLGLAKFGLFMVRSMVGLINTSNGSGVANAGLVYFNGRLLAMSEDDLPYHVEITNDGDLKTIGRFDFNGELHDPVIAHPKVDPISGDLLTLSYNIVKRPYLKFFRFDKNGHMSRDISIYLQQPTMIHDFAITESHMIIPDYQVVFNLSELVWGGSPVIYDPNKVSGLRVLSKDAIDETKAQWIEAPNCFCFHLLNAWEETDDNGEKIVVVIGSCMNPPDSIFNEGNEPITSELSEIRLNLNTGQSISRVIVSGMNLEVGQVNKHKLGQKTRYVYLAIADPWPKCSGIAKVDLETGNVTKFMYGDQRFGGEACFVPCKEEEEENEGYLMSFVRGEMNETSELVIVKASNMEQVTLLKLPTRVPYGFHGTFVNFEDLSTQARSYLRDI